LKRLYEPPAYDTKTPVGSWWEASVNPPPHYAAADKDISTDVAIIGAGFTGLNAALQLAEQHGISAVVLEAGQPGFGASGRNGGFACIGGAKMSNAAQIKAYGLAQTKAHVAAQCQAIDQVADNLARYQINADRHSDGEVLLAHKPQHMRSILMAATFDKTQFGLDFDPLDAAALGEHGLTGPDFHGGIRLKTGFALNPMKYVLGLAVAAKAAGVAVYGDSPVQRITQKAGLHVLTTPTARIRAKKVIIATNGYSSDDIPSTLGGQYLPILSCIMVTRPITRQEQRDQGWFSDLMAYDSRHLLHYFRLMPDGRFLFGQRGAVTADARGSAASRAASRRDFERMFPAWAKVETAHFWSGLVCVTRDLHQYVGPLVGSPGMFAAFGYHGNGVAMGSYAGRKLADLVAGEAAELPAIMATPLRRFMLPGLRRGYIRAAYVKYSLQDRFS